MTLIFYGTESTTKNQQIKHGVLNQKFKDDQGDIFTSQDHGTGVLHLPG